MNSFDLLEVMSGIRDQYIEEAAVGEAAEEKVSADTDGGVKKRRSFRKRILRLQNWAAGAAALVCLSILVPNVSPGAAEAFQNLPVLGEYFRIVTFRSYEYRDAVSDAVVEEAQVTAMSADDSAAGDEDNSGKVLAEGSFIVEEKGSEDSTELNSETVRYAAKSSAAAGTAGEAAAEESETESSVSSTEESETESSSSSAEAALAAAQVTEEIRAMARESIENFEKSIAEETGYHAMRFLCDKVTDSEEWLCLSVLSYTSSADGFEQVTHFVINKKTGRRVFLADCFREGTDYVTPVSNNIKEQMRSRMKNPDMEYWIDSEESPDEDFSEISEDQDFYINDHGDIVICFNEMEVAPMYMGTVEFVIPGEITDHLRADMPGL